MTERFPPPSYACTVWTNGLALMIAFPGQHTIAIPLESCGIEKTAGGSPLPSQRGWSVLRDLLNIRRMASVTPTVGMAGAPVQYDIEKMLHVMQTSAEFAAFKDAKAAKVRSRAEAAEFLDSIGLGDL